MAQIIILGINYYVLLFLIITADNAPNNIITFHQHIIHHHHSPRALAFAAANLPLGNQNKQLNNNPPGPVLA